RHCCGYVNRQAFGSDFGRSLRIAVAVRSSSVASSRSDGLSLNIGLLRPLLHDFGISSAYIGFAKPEAVADDRREILINCMGESIECAACGCRTHCHVNNTGVSRHSACPFQIEVGFPFIIAVRVVDWSPCVGNNYYGRCVFGETRERAESINIAQGDRAITDYCNFYPRPVKVGGVERLKVVNGGKVGRGQEMYARNMRSEVRNQPVSRMFVWAE